MGWAAGSGPGYYLRWPGEELTRLTTQKKKRNKGEEGIRLGAAKLLGWQREANWRPDEELREPRRGKAGEFRAGVSGQAEDELGEGSEGRG
ncbi:hypothetical protein CDL15_Pgr012992 [Punica granatum]|uniref:Uncharacterized protein n=1 Tax=Punica granatum TaxID=22663 RepID=A0A218XGC0_PUNGR|nr:hypothetical protein CDL15_Pgr012992 [Punica granatum]